MPTQKIETTLSKMWMEALRSECTEHKELIKIIKIHGGPYQTLGISDYLAWWMGYGLAIEFKISPNKPTPVQEDFLDSIVRTYNFGMVITFIKKPMTPISPRNILLRAKAVLGNGIFYQEVGF